MPALALLAVRLAARGAAGLGIPLAGFALLAGLALGAGPMGWLAWQLGKARITADVRAENNRLARDLAEARLDAGSARAVATAAWAAAARNAAAAAQSKERNDAYARELAARGPVGACGLTDGDVRRLRGNAWAVERRARRPAPAGRR